MGSSVVLATAGYDHTIRCALRRWTVCPRAGERRGRARPARPPPPARPPAGGTQTAPLPCATHPHSFLPASALAGSGRPPAASATAHCSMPTARSTSWRSPLTRPSSRQVGAGGWVLGGRGWDSEVGAGGWGRATARSTSGNWGGGAGATSDKTLTAAGRGWGWGVGRWQWMQAAAAVAVAAAAAAVAAAAAAAPTISSSDSRWQSYTAAVGTVIPTSVSSCADPHPCAEPHPCADPHVC